MLLGILIEVKRTFQLKAPDSISVTVYIMLSYSTSSGIVISPSSLPVTVTVSGLSELIEYVIPQP